MSDSEIEMRWDWPVADEEEGIEAPKRVKIERFLKKSDNEREPSWDNPIEFIVDKETGTWPAADYFWTDTDFVSEPTGARYVYEFTWSYGTTIFSAWYEGINIEASREGNFYGIDPIIDGYADDSPAENYDKQNLLVEKNAGPPIFNSGVAFRFPDVNNFLWPDYATKVTHLYLNLTTCDPLGEVQPELEIIPLTAVLFDGDTYAWISGNLDTTSIYIPSLPDGGGSNFTIDITSQKDNMNIWNGLVIGTKGTSPDGFASFHSSRSEDERARPRLYVQYYGEIDWSGL
jgi:hypothetical protein